MSGTYTGSRWPTVCPSPRLWARSVLVPRVHARRRVRWSTASKWKNRVVTPAELKSILTDARDRYADQAVLVRGDGRGALQHVVDVFSICNEVGIVNYKLATSRVEPAAP